LFHSNTPKCLFHTPRSATAYSTCLKTKHCLACLSFLNLWLAAETSNHSDVPRALRDILFAHLPPRASSCSTETTSSPGQSQLTSEPLVSRPLHCIFYILSH